MLESYNLPAVLSNATIKARFQSLLGDNAASFASALLNIWQNNQALHKCTARSILGAAGLVAQMRLSLSPSLGQAYIVPYGKQATLQIGVKGLIQLAHRTGRYTALHAGKVCEGELRGFEPITGEPITGEKISDEVIGYVAYMRLINGFEKTLFMTLAEIKEHGAKYSRTYSNPNSFWAKHFDAMATKTVLKRLLNTWGILSPEMVNALQSDQSVVDKNTFTYVDNGGDSLSREALYVDGDMVDSETGEVIGESEDESDA